jgi:hypothetical protein
VTAPALIDIGPSLDAFIDQGGVLGRILLAHCRGAAAGHP